MKTCIYRLRKLVVSVVAGAFVFQVAGCTMEDVQTQFANGTRTAVNGLLNIGVTALVNEVFDIDD